jgi:hypothetical protein
MDIQLTRYNHPALGDGAIAHPFHIGQPGRAVPEPACSTKMKALVQATVERFILKQTTLALLIIGLGLSAQAAVIAGPVTNPANGHTYYLLSPGTWTKAETEAIKLGGHLATIRNAAEDRWVSATFGSFSRALWIGLNDRNKIRQYAWSSGEPVTYVNWSGGQPDNRPEDGGTEFYVHIWPRAHECPGQWNDYSDGDTVLGFPLSGVVEIAPSETVRLSLPLVSSPGDSAGFTNLNSVSATSPELKASAAVELTWSSELNRVYQIQWTDSVKEPQWKNLGSVVRGTGGMLSIFDSTREHPRAYYRLLVAQ